MKKEKWKMKNERKLVSGSFSRLKVYLYFLFPLLFLLACDGMFYSVEIDGKRAVTHSPFNSFRDIPGVTDEEIAAIESLRGRYSSFTYGMTLTTEAFLNEKGQVNGYAALVCEWLTGLFDIRFKPEIYGWSDLLKELNDAELDFAGTLIMSDERKLIYHMTDSIAERQYKIMRLNDSLPLAEIARMRLPRYAFLADAVHSEYVAAVTEPGSYESVWVNDYAEVHDVLKRGEADAFIAIGVAEASLITHDDMHYEDFLPLIFNPVAICTAKQELAPIISVIDKALHAGAIPYLIHLYESGYRDYMKYKLSMHLSKKERDYIAAHPVVPFVANYNNYPICFYNPREKEWQGIFFDLMYEVSSLTGLSFNLVNDKDTEWPVIYEKLLNGEAALSASLVRTPEREDRFIWSETSLEPDYYALISKSDYHDIMINEIQNAKVGLARNTVYITMFRQWFPDHMNTVEYDSLDNAFSALERGEVDMVMATQRRLLLLTHFYELPGYKTNIVFDQPIETILGFNKNEEILCSIINKTFKVINTKGIFNRWMRMTYDYRAKVAEARLPWFIGAGVMSVLVLALILIMFLRSLGARKRLAKLVAEETSTLMAVLNGTPDHIFCKDLDSYYTRYNKSFRDYYQLPESATGRLGSEALGIPLDLVAYHESMDRKIFTEGETVVSEVYIPSPDGKETFFEVIKSPLMQDGKVTGLVGMARDITQRKAMEEETNKAYAKAETASEAKSRFIANMSHEMRTPMNAIVGLTDLMLEEDTVPDNAKETLKKINTAGSTLMSLINDVLDISKIESGKLDLNPVQYEVASFLNDIVALNIIRIESKPITFKLDIDEDLPESLFGDDLRIKQVLNNLLSNAFKYTKKGVVTLSVTLSSGVTTTSLDTTSYDTVTDSDCVWVSFLISDTGIGIRQEDIAKLFSDYYQVDTRANREIEGTGLGLSITKKFVDLMGGDITVESEYGKGTTFRVRIRQGFVSGKTIGKETAENLRAFRYYTDSKKRAQGKFTRQNLSYAKVLVVDDFPTNLDVAAGMLGKYKIQVDCLTGGQEAVDRIAAGEPVYNVVFMDHMMPGMDGVEATKKIRALGTKYAENLPIIALTANAVAGNEQMFLDNGFSAFLPKPFNVMLLDSIIQRWVRDKEKEQ
jgi:PAS domain S-box-containing protein